MKGGQLLATNIQQVNRDRHNLISNGLQTNLLLIDW